MASAQFAVNAETSGLPARATGWTAALAWLVFTCLFLRFGPYTGYSPAGFLDPWIPTGYFLNFADMLERFGYPYYISRLAYTLVGVALYKIFTPDVANFVMNALYLWLSCIGLYFATLRIFGFLPALLATIGLATNAYTMTAIAWDYPDGASIAYLLIGLWFALDAPRAVPRWLAWLVVGFFWGMAGAVNLIAGLVILPLCLLVILTAGLDWREWLFRTAFIFVGIALMLAVFCLLSWLIFGQWWFLGPQIGQLLYSLNTPGYLGGMWGTGHKWVLKAFRLAALGSVIMAAVLAALMLAGRRLVPARNAAIVFAVLFVSTALFLFVEFAMNAVVLRVFYTSSYLVVPVYLGLAAVLHLLLRDERSPVWQAVIVAATVGLLVTAHYARAEIGAWATPNARAFWWLLLIPAAMVLLAGARHLLGRSVSRLAAVALTVSPVAAMSVDEALSYVYTPSGNMFEAAVKASDILRTGTVKGRYILFWFENGEPYSQNFHSIASLYLWGWRDFTKEMPGLPAAELKGMLRPNMTFVHLTSDPAKIRQREAIMTARGIPFEPARLLTIRTENGMAFTLALQDVTTLDTIK